MSETSNTLGSGRITRHSKCVTPIVAVNTHSQATSVSEMAKEMPVPRGTGQEANAGMRASEGRAVETLVVRENTRSDLPADFIADPLTYIDREGCRLCPGYTDCMPNVIFESVRNIYPYMNKDQLTLLTSKIQQYDNIRLDIEDAEREAKAKRSPRIHLGALMADRIAARKQAHSVDRDDYVRDGDCSKIIEALQQKTNVTTGDDATEASVVRAVARSVLAVLDTPEGLGIPAFIPTPAEIELVTSADLVDKKGEGSRSFVAKKVAHKKRHSQNLYVRAKAMVEKIKDDPLRVLDFFSASSENRAWARVVATELLTKERFCQRAVKWGPRAQKLSNSQQQLARKRADLVIRLWAMSEHVPAATAPSEDPEDIVVITNSSDSAQAAFVDLVHSVLPGAAQRCRVCLFCVYQTKGAGRQSAIRDVVTEKCYNADKVTEQDAMAHNKQQHCINGNIMPRVDAIGGDREKMWRADGVEENYTLDPLESFRQHMYDEYM